MQTCMGQVRSAKRRAESMGMFSPYMPEYAKHPLAACIDNHITVLDLELALGTKADYTFCLTCILYMAAWINRFCDLNYVGGDKAASYWLELFLWRVDRVAVL